MDHHGIEYTVVQTINPIGWKWSFEREGKSAKAGVAFRSEAIAKRSRSIHLGQQRTSWPDFEKSALPAASDIDRAHRGSTASGLEATLVRSLRRRERARWEW